MLRQFILPSLYIFNIRISLIQQVVIIPNCVTFVQPLVTSCGVGWIFPFAQRFVTWHSIFTYLKTGDVQNQFDQFDVHIGPHFLLHLWMYHRLPVILYILNTIMTVNPSAYFMYRQVTICLLQSAQRLYCSVLYGYQSITTAIYGYNKRQTECLL